MGSCLPVDIWPDPTDPCGRNPVLLILPLINTVVSIEFDASDGADSAPAASDLDPPGSSWILLDPPVLLLKNRTRQ